MKKTAFISAVASILLSVWYLMAIVGLDIHIDHHDGEVFVVSLLSHTDCESLHPGDECHCLEHHHGMCHADDEDCENLVNLLDITGDGCHFTCDLAPATCVQVMLEAPSAVPAVTGYLYRSRIIQTPPREHLSSLCVLRV